MGLSDEDDSLNIKCEYTNKCLEETKSSDTCANEFAEVEEQSKRDLEDKLLLEQQKQYEIEQKSLLEQQAERDEYFAQVMSKLNYDYDSLDIVYIDDCRQNGLSFDECASQFLGEEYTLYCEKVRSYISPDDFIEEWAKECFSTMAVDPEVCAYGITNEYAFFTYYNEYIAWTDNISNLSLNNYVKCHMNNVHNGPDCAIHFQLFSIPEYHTCDTFSQFLQGIQTNASSCVNQES